MDVVAVFLVLEGLPVHEDAPFWLPGDITTDRQGIVYAA